MFKMIHEIIPPKDEAYDYRISARAWNLSVDIIIDEEASLIKGFEFGGVLHFKFTDQMFSSPSFGAMSNAWGVIDGSNLLESVLAPYRPMNEKFKPRVHYYANVIGVGSIEIIASSFLANSKSA